MSAITIQDIAARLNISHVAVSNALRGTGRIGKETRKTVVKMAAEMGYRPNASAQAMRSGRLGGVALLLGTVPGRSTLAEMLMCGIHDALAEHNVHLIIARLPDEKLTSEGVVPKTLRETMVDGLLVNYTDHIPQEMKRLISESNFPVVWINVDHATDCVRPDDHGAGRDATSWLIEQGHKQIFYVDYSHSEQGMDEAHYSARDRRQGYLDAMEKASLGPRVILRPIGPGRIEQHIISWLSAKDRPTAVLAYGDKDAEATAFAARAVGLKVPEDLQVVGFSDGPITVAHRSFPTWQVPQEQVGWEACRMLMQKIEDPSLTCPAKAVPFVRTT